MAELSKELSDKQIFADAARERIAAYRARAENLERERADLKLQIKCDVVKTVGGLVSGGAISAGLLTQMQSAIGAGTTLLAGCIYVADKIKEFAPVIQQLRTTEEEFKDDAGFGLHNFYSRLGRATQG